MFISALGSITGKHNRLGLPKVQSACVVVVDGLGSANLRYRAGHAPFLANQLNTDGSIMCGFPSTTVASLASFSTGVSAGEHGLVGYQIYDVKSKRNLNLLSGISGITEAMVLQPKTTVSELAAEAGVDCYFVGPPEYEGSGFTGATMRQTKYISARTIDDRVSAAKKLMAQKGKSLIYLYVPELDQRAHSFGSKSGQWVEKLEDLDLGIRQLVTNLPSQCGVLVTADHGVVDVARERHVYLDELELPGLASVGGDPRVLFLYFDQVVATSTLDKLRNYLGKRAIVADRNEIVAAGWYGKTTSDALERMPEIFLLAVGETALYHRHYAKPQSLNMVGQHGSISDDELFVPLLRLGGYKKNL
ncbi:alkaline phosphatase family protein [Rhodoluna lacicola]|uniref:AP superfamily protein n=1 Tax=Rhodoluna lacicola TaxID=529884 RepID=A0A060JMM8_9MICO|nr:alkaline phosphatase family protein [Rhodoluna lacicola]AIC47494.1 putative proteins of the AP superfamily [Rhodoluna lacicola]